MRGDSAQFVHNESIVVERRRRRRRRRRHRRRGQIHAQRLVHNSLQTMCPDIYPLQPPGKYIPDICPLDSLMIIAVMLKVKEYSSLQLSSPLRELACHIWDHTVLPATRQRWHTRLYPSKDVTKITDPEGCKIELTCGCCTRI